MNDSRSFRNVIALASLCLLVAGWGVTAFPNAGFFWLIGGLVGLASALGLDVVMRTRASSAEENEEPAS